MLIAAIVALIAVAIIAWFINNRLSFAGSARTATNVVLSLIIVGIGLFLINTYIPMANSIKTILNIVVVIATCIGVLQAFGLWGEILGLWNQLIHDRRFNPRAHEETHERAGSPHLH